MEGRVSVKQAATELGVTAPTLRWLMAEKEIDIGYVVSRPKTHHRSFVIYRKSLDEEKRKRGMMV